VSWATSALCAPSETTVEWAAESVSGTVSIKPSGWGTKVTLSVTREIDSITPEEPLVEEAAAIDEPAAAENEPAAAIEEPILAQPVVEESPPDQMAAEPTPVEPKVVPADRPEPRRGFFARLFGRRRKDAKALGDSTEAPGDSADQVDAFSAVSQALTPETVATTHAFDPPPAAEPAADEPRLLEPAPEASEPHTDISAELLAAEQVAVEQVTAVLTAALDRLGAAHHRPFSRA
jgi:hypothetical protein